MTETSTYRHGHAGAAPGQAPEAVSRPVGVGHGGEVLPGQGAVHPKGTGQQGQEGDDAHGNTLEQGRLPGGPL